MKRIATYLWQHLTIAALAVSLVAAPACTTQEQMQVVTDIQKFLPAVTNVAIAVCGFTPAASICATAIPTVQASANVLITSLNNYYTTLSKGTVPPTVWVQLETAISTFEVDANAILQAVRVVDPRKQQAIAALAAAASTLLAVVETLLPSPPSNTRAMFATAMPAGGPAKFSINAWVKDYNSKADAVAGQLPKAVAGKIEKVHNHSALVRYASAGRLQ